MNLCLTDSPDLTDYQRQRPLAGRAGVAAILKVLGATDQQVMRHYSLR